MHLTKTARYAIWAASELAIQKTKGPVRLAQLAARQEIPSAYGQQILLELKKAGLIRSIRGPAGGSVLARDPREITVLDVLSSVGQDFYLSPCSDPGKGCDSKADCPVTAPWTDATRLARRYLSGVTLQDLADRPLPLGSST